MGRDAAAVEALLIREVASQARAFQLQDLKCHKCRQVGSIVAWNRLTVCTYILAWPACRYPYQEQLRTIH
jgi:hypothetical protein